MRNIYKVLCAFPVIVLLFVFSSYAQPGTVTGVKTIQWMGIRSFGDTLDPTHQFMYFQGADFPAASPSLPHYYETIAITEGSSIASVRLVNMTFEPLSDAEHSILRDSLSIPESIHVNLSFFTQRKVTSALVTFLPFQRHPETGVISKLLHFQLEIMEGQDVAGFSAKNPFWAENSVLASGNWYKLGVAGTGIYKLTYNDLVTMGMQPSGINPRNIRIYCNGGGMLPESNAAARRDDLVENPIYVYGENDGSFDAGDYILFYARSPHTWTWDASRQKFTHAQNIYSDYTYCFLTTDLGSGKRVQNLPVVTTAPTHQVDRFQDFAFHEVDELNLTKSGKIWYGEKFDLKTTWELPPFSFPNIDGDIPVRMDVDLAARSTSVSTFKVYVNNGEAINQQLQAISPSFSYDYAIPANAFKNFYLNTPQVNVKVTYFPPVSGSIGWLNYVAFNVTRLLRMSGDQMSFRNMGSVGLGNVTEFTLSNASANITLWDVTDVTRIGAITTSLSGSNMVFRLSTDSLHECIAFNGTNFLSISNWTKVANQNLHATPTQDMIIITHPDFISQANELANIHRQEGLKVFVTTPAPIYNEFSSGAQDISAMRDFVKMIYDRAPVDEIPRYLLLFGDGSFDYKDRVLNNSNYVPTFQSINSLRPTESYVTDDFFGLLDANEGYDASGTLDIGVGRLPVQNQAEADQALMKIKRYLGLVPQSPGNTFSSNIHRLADWRNSVCFVGDDEDNNLHFDQAEDLSDFVNTTYPQYNSDKIYFDAYKQVSTPGGQRYPDVSSDINRRVGKGSLIVNYTGHGGETGWAHERVLEVSDINSWTNTWALPVFVTATCEFSRFDDPERISAGEWVFLNPNGGGISLFTTTRLSFSSSNFALNLNFYYNVFKKIDGKHLKMGEVIMRAKTPSNPNIRNFVLLGDPALAIAYPAFNVATTSINGNPVSAIPDTIRAFGEVTITGQVQDDQGNLLTGFNGTLYPTVFDKPAEITTLGNDPSSPKRSFLFQKNIIYKGKVSVINGAFSFTFIVPRDIAYKYGYGKISYYAQDGVTDANGYYDNFIIGGSENQFDPDTQGPDISLYMNDTTFLFGGITDQSPILLAYVSDLHGINTVGNGIGHDIVGVLDENTEHSIVLNDYYEADLNSYQSGKVRYPFYNLETGLHSLRVKVWDIYNNSSEAYTEFLVVEDGQLFLDNLINYPNPFNDHTWFVFNHNLPGMDLDVEIQIFAVTGEHIRTIKTTLYTDGFKAGPILWDGSGELGRRIGKGLYVYRLTVRTERGDHYEKTSKLVVLK